MLTAVVLKLQPLRQCSLPASHGGLAYAAALDLFLRIDPQCAQDLHDPPLTQTQDKPITVSPLTGEWEKRDHDLILDPDTTYSWRISSLASPISQQLLNFTSLKGGVRIGNAVFSVVSVATTAEEHKEAGRNTYDALFGEAKEGSGSGVVTLEFLTPTTFSSEEYRQPFPLPGWVFGRLLKVWNVFAPFELPFSREDIEKAVVLSNWKGETRLVKFSDYHAVGFVGKFTYKSMSDEPGFSSLLRLLAEFAFYAGVGWQTTHGLGQVRPRLTR